ARIAITDDIAFVLRDVGDGVRVIRRALVKALVQGEGGLDGPIRGTLEDVARHIHAATYPGNRCHDAPRNYGEVVVCAIQPRHVVLHVETIHGDATHLTLAV